MVLNAQTSYPQAQTYVLKLHRDAAPGKGRIIGRLEHVASGQQLPFNSAEELIARLIDGAMLSDAMANASEA